MTNLIIHPEVAGELSEAVAYYRAIDEELSWRFLDDVYRAIERAREHPLHYRTIHLEYRRVLCDQFPYRIVFEILEAEQAVHIAAVIHQSRHPEAWKKRLKE